MRRTRSRWAAAACAYGVLQVAAWAGYTPVEWRNIKDFGAVPNDGADDTEAIQAAFNSLDPKQGGTVYCPPGTYEVARPIVVSASAARLVGDGGPSYNEGGNYAGCTLVAKTDHMTLLLFAASGLEHRGPLIEYVNLRDATPSGHTATLLEIRLFNRWTVRNVSLAYANVALRVNAEGGDASWGYIPQLICKDSNVCIEQVVGEGGFLVVGGDYEPLLTGIRARGAQVRVVGAKFDCGRGSTGVHTTGHGGVVSSSLFEQCGIGVKIQNDNTYPWNGNQNRIIGNHFRGYDRGQSKGVEIGPNCGNNQVIGNTYEAVSVHVEDKGASTKRYEQDVGATTTLICGPGQAIRSITVKEGIVTGVSCGTP